MQFMLAHDASVEPQDLPPLPPGRDLLRSRLDASFDRCADDLRGSDRPGMARQCRPPRRRHTGIARARQYSRQYRYSDTLQQAADLSAAASAFKPHHTLKEYLEHERTPTGWWHNFPKHAVSLLKAWYGDNARSDNDFGYGWLPRIVGDHSQLPMTLAMRDGVIRGPTEAIFRTEFDTVVVQ
jgi:hypothetical protein